MPALLSHAREATLYIGLGARIDLRPAASSVELRHRFAVVFTLRRGWCSQVEWCSHVGSLRTTQIQPLDFRPPSCFSFRITDLAFELFGPSIGPANLISKFDFPTRLFFPTQDRMCLFACLHANDVASVDHDDALSWVQPIAPLLEEARAVQHRLSIASLLGRCCRRLLGSSATSMPAAYNGIFCRARQIAPIHSRTPACSRSSFNCSHGRRTSCVAFPLLLCSVLFKSGLASPPSTRVSTPQAAGSISTQLPVASPWVAGLPVY